MPAAGWRRWHDGVALGPSTEGYYWSSMQFNSSNGLGWRASENASTTGNWSKAEGYSIRCVR